MKPSRLLLGQTGGDLLFWGRTLGGGDTFCRGKIGTPDWRNARNMAT